MDGWEEQKIKENRSSKIIGIISFENGCHMHVSLSLFQVMKHISTGCMYMGYHPA